MSDTTIIEATAIDAQLDELVEEYEELKRFLRGAPVGFYASDERRLMDVCREHNKLVDDNWLYRERGYIHTPW